MQGRVSRGLEGLTGLPLLLAETEVSAVRSALVVTCGNVRRAAGVLGMSHWSLSRSLRRFGLVGEAEELREKGRVAKALSRSTSGAGSTAPSSPATDGAASSATA